MLLFWSLIGILLGIFLIWLGSRLLLRNIQKLAFLFHFTPFLTAFIFAAFGTSLPELSVALNSLIFNAQKISLGNVVGSTMFLSSVIFGLYLIFFKDIKIVKEERREIIYGLLLSFLPLFLALDGELSRIDGLISLLSYLIVVVLFFGLERKLVEFKDSLLIKEKIRAGFFSFLALLLIVVGGFIVMEGSEFFVILTGISEVVFGFLALGFMTNIPDLILIVQSKRLHFQEVPLAEILGSVLFNLNFIVGLLAIISPLVITPYFYFVLQVFSYFFLASLVIIWTGFAKHLPWQFGALMILLFLLVYLSNFYLGILMNLKF